jgi:thioesterase domain-containing protein
MFGEFLTELKQKEIYITFLEGKIEYNGPDHYINAQFIERLEKYKGKLIKHLWPSECTNIMPINAGGSKIPFILIHGDEINYSLSEYMGKDQPFYGFFHYGSKGENILFESVEELAKNYIYQLQKVLPHGPYYLGGFSFGGIIAFEMAIQLRKMEQEVSFLGMIDSTSPLAMEPFKWSSNFFKISGSNILVLPAVKLLRILKLSICKSFIKINKPIPAKLRTFYITDKYKILTRRYQPEKFDGAVLLFRARTNKSSFKYLGWEKLVNNIKMFNIDAGHLTIKREKKNVKIIFEEIEKYLL